MQSWGEDTFRDIIRDELSVTSEQNQGYHNTTNKLEQKEMVHIILVVGELNKQRYI